MSKSNNSLLKAGAIVVKDGQSLLTSGGVNLALGILSDAHLLPARPPRTDSQAMRSVRTAARDYLQQNHTAECQEPDAILMRLVAEIHPGQCCGCCDTALRFV